MGAAYTLQLVNVVFQDIVVDFILLVYHHRVVVIYDYWAYLWDFAIVGVNNYGVIVSCLDLNITTLQWPILTISHVLFDDGFCVFAIIDNYLSEWTVSWLIHSKFFDLFKAI